jgi:ABC-type polar amino acid transport system ATPase subunit
VTAADGTPALAVALRGVRKRFGEHVVLDGVDLAVASGEVVALLGPSGSGKSTLLRCVNGLEAFDEGEMDVLGHRVAPGPPDAPAEKRWLALRARIGFVFQAFHLYPHLTARRNVTLAPTLVRRVSRDEADRRALELLDRVGLAHKADASPRSLSGGERQRVAIARALAMDSDVLLFDEPTSALDPENSGEVLDVIRALASEHRRAIVLVTHEIGFAAEAADRVAFLDAGRVLEDGPPASVLRSPSHERTRRFLARVGRHADGSS